MTDAMSPHPRLARAFSSPKFAGRESRALPQRRSFAHAICAWMRPPRPQSVPAMTFSRPTSRAKRTMRSATRCGCSTTLVAWLTTPGMSSLPSGSFDVLPDAPFVLVRGVAGFDRVGAGVDLEHEVDDVGERDVGGVRPVPAAPADVVAHAVFRQAAQRVVQRLDAHAANCGTPRAAAPGLIMSQLSGRPGSSICSMRPASMIALYSSRIASASAKRNSSSLL